MAVGVKVVNRPGSFSQQALPAGDRRGAGRHVPPLREELLRQRDRAPRARPTSRPSSTRRRRSQYPERHRGLHRLMLRDDGQVRCVACMMCPTVCPAHCITIVPEEAPDGRIEKRPKIFEIDELRCVVCGLCAEACPCDAIRMDTLEHAKPTYRRVDAILDKEELMSRGIASSRRPGRRGRVLAREDRGRAADAARGRRRPRRAAPGPVPVDPARK